MHVDAIPGASRFYILCPGHSQIRTVVEHRTIPVRTTSKLMRNPPTSHRFLFFAREHQHGSPQDFFPVFFALGDQTVMEDPR